MKTAAKRSGPFWDGVEGRAPIPRAAATLGFATLNPDQFQSTLDFNVRFLRPVRPGRIVGKGRVVHRDADMPISKRPSTTRTMRPSRLRPLRLR